MNSQLLTWIQSLGAWNWFILAALLFLIETLAPGSFMLWLGLSAILSPPYFVQAQSLPFDYQTTVLRGNATKIDALLMREYLHRRQAVPAPGRGRGVAGGAHRSATALCRYRGGGHGVGG